MEKSYNPFEELQKENQAIKDLLIRVLEKLDSKGQQSDEVGGLELAMEITGYKKKYIYELTSKNIIPHSRVNGGRLRFERSKLIDFVRTYKITTQEEIRREVQQSLRK